MDIPLKVVRTFTESPVDFLSEQLGGYPPQGRHCVPPGASNVGYFL